MLEKSIHFAHIFADMRRFHLTARNPSDNLKNLFELPVIFYAAVLYLYVTRQVDALHLGAAWIFFAFRVLHSVVHCTFNHIKLRFFLYLVSSLALWLMVIRIALTLPR
jgi:hypothetical protein